MASWCSREHLAAAKLIQAQLLRDLGRVHSVWQVLLVGEDQEDGVSQFILGQLGTNGRWVRGGGRGDIESVGSRGGISERLRPDRSSVTVRDVTPHSPHAHTSQSSTHHSAS